MADEGILRRAEFNAKVQTYWLIGGAVALTCTCVGIVDAPGFREAVLAQRDKVADHADRDEPAPSSPQSRPDEVEKDRTLAVLEDIRESLGRIENRSGGG